MKNFSQADPEYGARIAELLKQYKSVSSIVIMRICDISMTNIT